MNVRLTVKSPWLFAFIMAAVCFLSPTESKADKQDKAKKATADPMVGKEAGQVRDDNGLKMKLVWCPAGKFTMGSPKSEAGRQNDEEQVEVTLTKGYWLGKYEVTQAEWKQMMATEPWKDKDATKEGKDFPVTWVKWDDAMEFCRMLTEREHKAGGLPEGWEYRLPTEAQWERACRAGTQTKFSFGDDPPELGEYAWFVDNTAGAGERYAHQVGRKKRSPWGLHDMHGNVWEWCRDYYSEKLPGGHDPEVSVKALDRVLRGGCWRNEAADCRMAVRFWYSPVTRLDIIGFRVALSSVQPAK